MPADDITSSVAVSTDLGSQQLERNSQKQLFIVTGTEKLLIKEQWSDYAATWLENGWFNSENNYDKREAIAVESVKNSAGTITGYKLAIKRAYKNGDAAEQITWDVLNIDAQGKLNNDSKGPNGQYVQLSVYGLYSIASFETVFDQDFNGDGVKGINYDALSFVTTDTTGVRLARDKEKGLYIVKSVGSDGKVTDATPVLGSLESSYQYGNDYNKREAIAIAEEKDSAGTVTGYKVAIKSANKWGTNPEQITYDIYQVDLQGRQTSQMMANPSGGNADTNVYGAKSLMPYEALFDQDFNNDGFKGIKEDKLQVVSTNINGKVVSDSNGAQLLREIGNNALYFKVNNDIKPLPNSGWMESSSSWGANGYSKREVVAIQEVRSSNNTITGFKIASKYTYKNDGQDEQVTYEINTLDANGRQTWNEINSNLSNLKSLTPYEDMFNEDFNSDGSYGVDVTKLTDLSTDTTGVKFKRDADKALYVVNETNTKAVALPTDSNLENNSNAGATDNYSKREVLAIEAVKTQNVITGYKVLQKNANKWGGNAEQVSYDVITLDDKFKQVWSSMVGNVYVDPNTYGAKSLMPLEELFQEDFNGDGVKRINESKLEVVSTDTNGAQLYRETGNKALYFKDGSTVKALPNSGWLESYNEWTNGYYKSEAVAIQAKGSGYILAIKRTNKNNDNDPQITYDVMNLDASGKQSSGMMAGGSGYAGSGSSDAWGIKSLAAYEEDFNEDFNNDKSIGVSAASLTGLSTDTKGVVLKRDKDKALYVVFADGSKPKLLPNSGWMEYNNTWGTNSYNKREAIAIQEVKSGTSITGYKLAIKQVNKWDGGTEQVTYDILSLDVNLKQTYGTSSVNGTYNDPNIYGAKSLTPYEDLLKEDFNNDGVTGINVATLTSIATDTQGVRLMRDADSALYIVSENGAEAMPLPSSMGVEYKNEWMNGYNRREVVTIESIKTNAVVTGYKLLVKQTNKWDTNPEQVTYDLLTLDESGKQVFGGMKDGTWSDPNTYGLKSITPYEELFKEDFNKDGSVGVKVSSLTLLATDTFGVKLARDADKGLYIVNPEGTKALAVTNAGWLEYDNTWGTNNYNKREALAVESIVENGKLVGYSLAMKSTNKWESNPEQVTYDVLRIDAEGKLTYGEMVNGAWKDYSIWGAKSLAPQEVDFQQDFNGDGVIGVDASKLTAVDTDTKGMTLARDADKGLYILDASTSPAKAIAITNAGWLESNNSWSTNSYNKREAIAVEAVKDSAGNLTGYKLATRSTNKWDSSPEQITWDIISLDTKGRVNSGAMMYGTSQENSVWGAKSIAPYEKIFNQDLNLDGSIGIDISKLAKVESDTYGVKLLRDADRGLYLVDGEGAEATSTPVGTSGYMEYNNAWNEGYSKREAVAVEAVKNREGVLTGYKIAMKASNKWSGSTEQVSWDVLSLDLEGRQDYGRNVNGVWTDPNTYGAKSIASFEGVFGQDLNADGSIGIDISTLTKVASDTRGVGLRRDREQALYLIDTLNGVEVARAIGNGSWLEYDNSWSGNTNKREVVAIEANPTGVGYRMALKQTNSWSGSNDVSWEVMNLDATGKVTWNYNAGNFVTRKAKQVEEVVQEDLDGDSVIGVSLSDLELISTDQGSERLAWEKNDKTLFILEGVATSAGAISSVLRKVAVIDSAGTTPQLETQSSWWGGSSATKVYAVAKQSLDNGDYQYRLAVKVERTSSNDTTTSWQIHTVTKDGVLDWSKVATSNNPDRFESLFNIDFNGDGSVSSGVGALSSIDTDKKSVLLKEDKFGTLYIYDDAADAPNQGITYVVDSKGGSPNFGVGTGNVTSKPYAAHKMADGSYRLAIQKTDTSGSEDVVKWEVHTLAKVNANFEAAIEWSKTKYLTDVKDVEALIDQDIDGDNTAGYPVEVPVNVLGDTGDIKAALDTQGRLSIVDPSLSVSPMAVVDASGGRPTFESDISTTDANGNVSRLLKKVIAAEAVGTGDAKSYKVLVTSTVSETGKPDAVMFEIHSVSKTGVASDVPVVTPSAYRWESVFKQDLTNDDSSEGVVQEKLNASNDADMKTDKYGAVYVKSGAMFIPVLDSTGANVTFAEAINVGGTSFKANPVAAESHTVQVDGVDKSEMLVAVKIDVKVGELTTTSWAVHSLDVNDAEDAAEWQSVEYYDDATDLTPLFQQDLSVVG